jgi:NADH-quinone oxidoreductase subunit M
MFNHGLTAATLFWFVAMMQERTGGERLALAPVIGLMLVLGLVPQLIVDTVNPTVVNLLAHWRF